MVLRSWGFRFITETRVRREGLLGTEMKRAGSEATAWAHILVLPFGGDVTFNKPLLFLRSQSALV